MDSTYGTDSEYHVWVGLDPGLTTGWAVLADDGKVFGHGTFVEDNVYEGVDKLIRGLHRSKRRVTVVIEGMPRTGGMSDLSQRLEHVRQLITDVVIEVYDLETQVIPPGEWKTSRIAKLAKPKAKTQHEKDAIIMTAYAIAKEARRPNG